MKNLFCGVFTVAFLLFSLGTVHGTLPAEGDVMWSYDTGDSIYSSAAIGADGTVYMGSLDNNLYAINPNGSLKWSYATGGGIFSSPAIGADGTIYVGSRDNKLYAITDSGATAALKWSYATNGGIDSSPAIGADGTIYVGSNDLKLYAITDSGATATFKWSYTTENQVVSSPAIGLDGTIYVGSDDNKLYALNPDGTLKWSYATGGYIRPSPAIGLDGTIYVGSEDHKLYAINPNGRLKWSYDVGSLIISSPAIGADGTIYVGSGLDYTLYAINPNGRLKWSYTGAGGGSSPAVGADGTIYMGSGSGTLYAINPAGTLKWSSALGGEIYLCPAIGSDGTIYVGSVDSRLYAIYSLSLGLANSSWPMFLRNTQHTGLATLPTLVVTKSGAAINTVTSSPSGIDCGTTCTASYPKNTKVTLYPAAEHGNVFTGWSGDCKGTGKCTVNMNAYRSVEAAFAPGSCTYTVSPASKTVTYKGGTVAINVTAKDYTYCAAPDISIGSGWGYSMIFRGSNNKGSMKVAIPELDSANDTVGTIAVEGATATITQKGKPCAFTLTPKQSDPLSKDGTTGLTFTVDTTPADCQWTAVPAKTSTWVHITSGASGTGKADVTYDVDANTGKAARNGNIIVTAETPVKKSASYKVIQSNK